MGTVPEAIKAAIVGMIAPYGITAAQVERMISGEQTTNGQTVISYTEAREMLGVSTTTLWRLIKAKKIRKISLSHSVRSNRIIKESVEALIAAGGV